MGDRRNRQKRNRGRGEPDEADQMALATGDEDSGTLGDQTCRDSLTDAGITARHDGYLPCELAHGVFSPFRIDKRCDRGLPSCRGRADLKGTLLEPRCRTPELSRRREAASA